jgi:uncharacterized membrane protein YwaF
MKYAMFFIMYFFFIADCIMSKIMGDETNYGFWIGMLLFCIWANIIEIRKTLKDKKPTT